MLRSYAAIVGGCAMLLAACSDAKETQGPPTPSPAAVDLVQVTPGEITLSVGGTRKLDVSVRDRDGRELSGRTVNWSSSATSVATVDGAGNVTAVGNGSATITAAAEGRTGTARIDVASLVASIEIITALDTLEAYDVVQLQATVRDSAGRPLTGPAVRWQSSDPAVAAVDSMTGRLTGIDRGTVTVTARSEGKTATATRVVVIRYRSISTGTAHACDIASGGIVWCWGLNGLQGRIGMEQVGDGVHSATPVRLQTDLRFRQVATYGATTCGLTIDGAAHCWGANGWGLFGTGSSSPYMSTQPVAVSGGYTFSQIAAGPQHICALTTDGRAMCWGNNGSGELGNGNRSHQYTPVHAAPALRFAHLATGSEYSCGVTTAGETWCWGYDGLGNLGDGRKISFGNTYSLAPVKVTGGHTFVQVRAGQHTTCGRTAGDQVFCWGRGPLGSTGPAEISVPREVAGGHAFRALSVGFNHACGIAADAAVWCWGNNGNGQLGLVIANGSVVPVRAGGSIMAAEIAAANVATGSASFTCAISQDRLTTQCWGRNDVGQLGIGTTTGPTIPNTTPGIVVGQRPLN